MPPTYHKADISITIDGYQKSFNTYYQAYHYISEKVYEIDKIQRKERAEGVYKNDVNYVYEAKFVLEEKFGFWVAKSKDHKYNIRRDGKAFKFGSRTMFGLTGKELIEFYQRYVKVVALEG